MKKNKNNKISIIINLLFILVFSFITIGYAAYNKDLSITSNLSLVGNGELYIRSIDLVDSSNVSNSSSPSISNNKVDFNITFSGEQSDFYANYLVTVVNNSFYDYTYTGVDLDYSLSRTDGVEDGSNLTIHINNISNGETIAARSTKTFNIMVTLNANDPEATYVTEVISNVNNEVVQEAKLLATITPKQGNLRNNDLAMFTLDVISTYDYGREFTLDITDSNFEIVNQFGNSLDPLTIHANSEETYNFYIKKRANATFVNDSKTTTITLNSAGIPRMNVDSVTILVTQNSTVTDTIPPVVGNVTLTMENTEGVATASWSLIDYGISGVDHYMINLYNATNDRLVNSYTGTDATSYTLNNLSEGEYYIIVYAIDDSGNSGNSYVSSASTSSGYASKSSNGNFKWRFSVTNNLTNISSNGNNYALYHQAYTATLSVSGLRSLPNTITVTMGGTTLTSGTDYTYSSNNGQLKVENVTGDLVITGTATCLLEGTKVLLANGKTKNIEDIRYDDLLLVFNYETGKMVEEYPIWIEKEGKTSIYQKTTFSDGSILKTLGWHGVFSVDKNMFVSVDNPEEFHEGTHILKIDKNGKKKVVSVTKIEKVKENASYYHVVSTRYYNIIANNFLTTDGTVILSNLYGFNEDQTWTELRDLNKDLYTKEELDILPNYMYIGLRAMEGKYLQTYGMSRELFLGYLMNNQLTDEMLPIKKNSNGKLLFPVSTSLSSKTSLYPEGSIYLLPKKEGVVKYLDTSKNKYYNPGDQVKIELGTHFKAIMKK